MEFAVDRGESAARDGGPHAIPFPTGGGRDGTPIVIIGAGNIGSHLVQHVARLPSGAHITLIDRDVYEEKNLRSQAIVARDVGRAKAMVQARRLRHINPTLQVVAIADAMENVPLGVLRDAIVLGCLDSRAARRHLAAAAWHVGAIAYVDAGVEPSGMLARINVYVAGDAAPCFECAWDASDYAAQEQQYPCDALNASAALPSVTATDAPSCLGALAAALQAIECRKLMGGIGDRALVGRQLVLDATWHKHYVTTLRRNPNCRFDHQVWRIESLPLSSMLGTALAFGDDDSSLRVPGHAFLRRLSCVACGRSRALLRLSGRLHPAARRCATCGQPMRAAGFDMVERLRREHIPAVLRGRALGGAGLLPGDIVAVSDKRGDRYFELRATRKGK